MKKTLIIFIAVLALGIGLLTALKQRSTNENPLADAIGGEFIMTDQNGGERDTREFLGKVRLMYFGYTYCPDACPMALGHMTRLMQSLTLEQRQQVQPIFVSVDGERDTPEQLQAFLKPFDAHIVALTGDANEAKKLFHIYSKKVDLGREDGFYMVDHTTSIFVLDKRGKYVTLLSSHNQTAKDILAAVQPLLD